MDSVSCAVLCSDEGIEMTNDNQLTSESILRGLQVIMQIFVRYSTVNILLKFQCKVGYLVFSIY